MTVFVLPNDLGINRLGVTASKKLSTKSHDRNRAKRLVRETFRLSKAEMPVGGKTFDWVINARRELLNRKAPDAILEFSDILDRVREK
jgi:ribonuclease P protein component